MPMRSGRCGAEAWLAERGESAARATLSLDAFGVLTSPALREQRSAGEVSD